MRAGKRNEHTGSVQGVWYFHWFIRMPKTFRDEYNLDISTTPCFASGGFLQVTLSPAQELSLNKFKTAYALTCSPFGECYAALFQVG